MSPGDPNGLGARLFRLGLRAFPPDVEDARRADMELLIGELARDARRGGREGIRFWVPALVDLGRQMVGAWWRYMARGGRRASSGGGRMGGALHDLRMAVRRTVRQPRYSLTVVALIAIAIGGNAAAFRLFDGLFRQPLPFPDGDRLVDVDVTAPAWGLEYVHVAFPDYHAWREGNRTLDELAVYDEGELNMVGEGGTERLPWLSVSHSMDDVLGLSPLLGRFFTAEEDVEGGPANVMISEGLWEREYARSPDVLGASIVLNGFTFTILGVLPAEAGFIGEADIWFPMRRDPATGEGNYSMRAVGLLAEGVSPEQAEADLVAVHRARIPEKAANAQTTPVVQPLRTRYLGHYRASSVVALIAVGGVLVLACVNLAGLVLARTIPRVGEIGLRLALGASRTRVTRGLVAESFVLAATGSVLGTLLGLQASSMVIDRMAGQFAPWVDFSPNLPLIGFLSVITVGALALFGVAPALLASQKAAAGLTRRSTGGRGQARTLGLLIAGQVALALALLVAGTGVGMDTWRLVQTDAGVEAEGLRVFRISTLGSGLEDEESEAFTLELLSEVGAMPGVEAVTAVSQLPLTDNWGWTLETEAGAADPESAPRDVSQHTIAGPDYFSTMGIDVVAGRAFGPLDGVDEDAPVAIVSEAFVSVFFGGSAADAVGQRIRPRGNETWMTILGVVEDVRHNGIDEAPTLGFYQPYTQFALAGPWIAVRGREGRLPDPAALRARVHQLHPGVVAFDFTSLDTIYRSDNWARAATAVVLAGFAGVALLMTVLGLYGTTSFVVRQRRREIGVRLALGAAGEDIRGLVLRRAGLAVAIGIVGGLAATLAVAPLVAALMVDPQGTRVGIVGAITLVIAGVTLIAAYLPAQQAASVDPAQVMRAEG